MGTTDQGHSCNIGDVPNLVGQHAFEMWALCVRLPNIIWCFQVKISGKNDLFHNTHITNFTRKPLLQCTMCCLGSMFSFQPNKLRHILKFMFWYTIEHIFVPACSVGRKTWFLRKPWFSNSKFAISGLFFPILSAPKIMFPVPENKKRDKF